MNTAHSYTQSATAQPLAYLLGALQFANERKTQARVESLIPTVKQTGR